ncbi:MAG: T9SS type A sorting domain-containing protein [bacterium]|nr:T9SS type A sorting domain-containing protein [bacterium]
MKFVIISLLAWSVASSRTLLVPDDYISIGGAFEALETGDTVLISPGVYVESLSPPELQFVMKSTVTIDSTATEFVVIDPTELPDSDSLSCVKMTGGNATFEDIVFRNRSAMTAGRLSSEPAGVVGADFVERVVFRRCVFDSVLVGVTAFREAHIENCRFIGSRGGAANSARPGKIYADSTWFDGATGSLVALRRGGLIRDCLFTHKGASYHLLALGDSAVILNCRFVGLDTLNGRALWVRPRCESEVRNCTFENIVAGYYAVVEITDSCVDQPKGWECTLQFVNNRFINCGSHVAEAQQGGEMITVLCANQDRGFLAVIDSNRIDSIQHTLGVASCLYTDAGVTARGNDFGQQLDGDVPQVVYEEHGDHDTLFFRFNRFCPDHIGMERTFQGPSLVDARGNWWGHPSGPYHPITNPDGQGAEVDDGIAFNPWLMADPDTTEDDTSEVAVDDGLPHVAEDYSLSVYPNPFNATTGLQINVARAGVYEVALYDLTGRLVATLYDGRVEQSRAVRVDASAIASGVYFARLSGHDGPLATAKLLVLK